MTTRVEELRDLFSYHHWANGRLLDATAALSADAFERDLGGSFGSIRATLAHILGADWVWLQRWLGAAPRAFPEWDLSTHDLLRAKWGEVERAQRDFVDGLADEDIGRVIAYTMMSGAAFANPLGELCRHVVNHATYHRGQVVTMLRQLDVEPPHTDLIVYYREGR